MDKLEIVSTMLLGFCVILIFIALVVALINGEGRRW